MGLDPQHMADEASYEGHLSGEPMARVLATLVEQRATGRLTVQESAGASHMFFMQGRPVGVVLAQVTHPLGQLLLELGKIDSAQFVRAQRDIGDGERLPGQVFIEIGAITDVELKEILGIQARRKAQQFAALRAAPFTFSQGLGFLVGFKSSPSEGAPLVYHALAAELDPDGRRAWLKEAWHRQVRAPAVKLGGSPEAFGFGRAEERFLQRLAEWQTVEELDQFGTLPSEDVAVLLRFLELQGQLEMAPPGVNMKPKPAPAAPLPAVVVDLGPEPAPPPRRPAPGNAPPASASAVTRERELPAPRAQPPPAARPSVVVDLEPPGPPTKR